MGYIGVWVTICGFFILFALELRHRLIAEEIAQLKNITNELDKEILNLKAEIKTKKSIYEENR